MTSQTPSIRRETQDSSPPRSSLSWRWLLLVFLVALTLRAGLGTVRLVRSDNSAALEFPDEQQYWLMADSLQSGNGLADELGFRATRMPLYPGMLSVFTRMDHGVVAARVFHWLIGAVAAMLTAGLAASLLDRRAGLIAGLLVAVDPFLVFFSSLLLTETLFLAALVGLWWTLGRLIRESGGSISRWATAGVLAALCVYIRESSLGLVICGMGLVCLCHRFHRRTWIGAVVACGILIAALVPWAVRNERVIGEWCWLTTRGGISLYDGVGPQATGASDLGNIKQMPAVRNLSEVEWNRYFFRESFEAIKTQPTRILRLAGVKLGRMWNPVPNVETYRSRLVRFVAAAWSLPVFLLALFGVRRLWVSEIAHGRWMVLLLVLPALYLSVLHTLFVGSVRYRLGAMPMIEILAAWALVGLIDRLRRNARAGETTRVD